MKKVIIYLILGLFSAFVIGSLLSLPPSYWCQTNPTDPSCQSGSSSGGGSSSGDGIGCDSKIIKSIIDGEENFRLSIGNCNNMLGEALKWREYYEKAKSCLETEKVSLQNELDSLKVDIATLQDNPIIKRFIELQAEIKACINDLAKICCGGGTTTTTTTTTTTPGGGGGGPSCQPQVNCSIGSGGFGCSVKVCCQLAPGMIVCIQI